MNPYTCRLLIRIDWFIWRLRGVKVFFSQQSGYLVRQWPSGSMSAMSTHFPDKWFIAAAYIQNRWPRTRRLLSI